MMLESVTATRWIGASTSLENTTSASGTCCRMPSTSAMRRCAETRRSKAPQELKGVVTSLPCGEGTRSVEAPYANGPA